MRRFLIVCALAALTLPTLAQQQQPFQEQIDVNLVLLDVIVTDSKGNQILGLTKDDFVVEEDGAAQTVESVDYFTNRRLLTAREDRAPFPVERVREERYFIFFFDKPSEVGGLFDQLTVAREAVRDFVRNEMKEGDRVAIAGHDARLKIYSDFTSDKAQLEKAIDESARFGRGIDRPTTDTGILHVIDRDEMIKHTGRVYTALDTLADATRHIRARKNLVLFSPGIADQGETVRGGLLVDRSRFLDPMIESLNAANVSVYGVQLQRDIDSTPLFHQRLEEISSETGGNYFRFNTSFKPAIERIENINNGYYLLTYRTNNSERRFKRVSVTLRNPEFRVIARKGYQAGR